MEKPETKSYSIPAVTEDQLYMFLAFLDGITEFTNLDRDPKETERLEKLDNYELGELRIIVEWKRGKLREEWS